MINGIANCDNINFIINNIKFFVPVVNLLAKSDQKLLKRLSKRFERSVYWNEYKTKIKNKNTTN